MQKSVNQIEKYEIITFNKTIFKKVGQVVPLYCALDGTWITNIY